MKHVSLILFAVLVSFASYATVSPITGTFSLCMGSYGYVLADSTHGGRWTSSDTSVARINISTGVYSGISAGTAIITYMLDSSDYATAIVTINPTPSAPYSPQSIYGGGVMLFVCSGNSLTLRDSLPGGEWDLWDPPLSTGMGYMSDSTFIASGAGSVEFTYRIVSTGCSANGDIIIYDMPGPITGFTVVEVGATRQFYNSITDGYWRSNTPSIATIDFYGVVTGVSPGTDTIFCFSMPSCQVFTVITVIPPTEVPVKSMPETGLYIYPNPVYDNLNIVSASKIGKVTISNLLGQTVFAGAYDDEKVLVNVADLPVGLYFIKINETEVRRFVKN